MRGASAIERGTCSLSALIYLITMLIIKDRVLSDPHSDWLASSSKLPVGHKTRVRASRGGFAVKTRLRSNNDAVLGQILREHDSTWAKAGRRRNRLASGRIRVGLSDFHRRRARDPASWNDLPCEGVLRIGGGAGGEGRSHQPDRLAH